MSTTIIVTRDYIPQSPVHFTIQVDGQYPTKDDIQQQIAASLSSPRISSYTFDINPFKKTAKIHHNKSSQDRFNDKWKGVETRLSYLEGIVHNQQSTINSLENSVRDHTYVEEEVLQWEVYTRLAKVINSDTLAKWRVYAPWLVRMLEKNKLDFLPHILTASAISWCNSVGPLDPPIPALDLYSPSDRTRFLRTANQNERYVQIIDEAWQLFDPIDLRLMLTAWAKRSPVRNGLVHETPLVTSAERFVVSDGDFADVMKDRARLFIHDGVDSKGDRLFRDS